MKKILILMLTLIFTLNLFSGISGATLQEELEEMQEAKQQKKQAKKIAKMARGANLKVVETWANEGDVQAQMIMYYAYAHGLSVKKNLKTAAEWRAKAERTNAVYARNFIPATFYSKKIPLARLYGIAAYRAQVGIYLKPNFDDAVRWAELGESEQDTLSLSFLGSAYYTGRGVRKDYKAAIDYFKKSSDEPLSLTLLSDAYAKGNGVEKDLKKSKFYADYLTYVRQAKIDQQKAKGEKRLKDEQRRADKALSAEDRKNPFLRAKERAAEKLAAEKEKIEIENAKQAAAEKNKLLEDEVAEIEKSETKTEAETPATETPKTETPIDPAEEEFFRTAPEVDEPFSEK